MRASALIVRMLLCVGMAFVWGCERPDQAVQTTETTGSQGGLTMQKATFAAGCFWGVEAAFRQIEGVTDAVVGYTGGTVDDPTYRQVCTDLTGHAEAVEVSYDPDVVSYEELLNAFWRVHDPTQLNRQGPDTGTQYRSAVFYHTSEQQAAATASMQRLAESGTYRHPIVTQIVPAVTFWRAEDHHQRYLEKRGLAACRVP